MRDCNNSTSWEGSTADILRNTWLRPRSTFILFFVCESLFGYSNLLYEQVYRFVSVNLTLTSVVQMSHLRSDAQSCCAEFTTYLISLPTWNVSQIVDRSNDSNLCVLNIPSKFPPTPDSAVGFSLATQSGSETSQTSPKTIPQKNHVNLLTLCAA
jgi:hypothetical protein